ncbi:MAG: hypothetical protein Q8934_19920 [Bacillota bacterium]|nr:hypothetical protein [Bacillota bacterium]
MSEQDQVMTSSALGKSHTRLDAMDKVTGAAKFTNDYTAPGLLYAVLVTSPFSHATFNQLVFPQRWPYPVQRLF